jgi:hypothetical protein
MGDIVTAGAADLATALFSECTAVAVAPCPAFVERSRAMLTASMLRDIERRVPI